MKWHAVAMAVVLVACQPEREAEQPGPDPTGLNAECTAVGGTVTFGLAGPTCATPEPDAGKTCSGSADCSGVCLAETRTCSPVTPYFGCHELYENGETVVICID